MKNSPLDPHCQLVRMFHKVKSSDIKAWTWYDTTRQTQVQQINWLWNQMHIINCPARVNKPIRTCKSLPFQKSHFLGCTTWPTKESMLVKYIFVHIRKGNIRICGSVGVFEWNLGKHIKFICFWISTCLYVFSWFYQLFSGISRCLYAFLRRVVWWNVVNRSIRVM